MFTRLVYRCLLITGLLVFGYLTVAAQGLTNWPAPPSGQPAPSAHQASQALITQEPQGESPPQVGRRDGTSRWKASDIHVWRCQTCDGPGSWEQVVDNGFGNLANWGA